MKKWFVLFVLCFALSCSKEAAPVKISFYFWKTNFSLSLPEKQLLDSLQVEKLYIRYFDVAMKGDMAIPIMPISFEKEKPTQEIVPVVYIKNEVMLNSKVPLHELADKIMDYIQQINTRNAIQIKEVQVDCDWTLNSKDRFFSFINFLQQRKDISFSSTIRLHQTKYYKKTGIPNVDHGVLMYYNMGTIAADSLNSIYDRKIAHRYIESLAHYPMRLDVALPIYSWAVHSRQGKILELISRVRLTDLENHSQFKKIDATRFEVLESGNYFGQYLKKEDQIKIESIQAQELKEMVADLKKNLAQPPHEIIFYDLDASNLKVYEKEKLEKLANSF